MEYEEDGDGLGYWIVDIQQPQAITYRLWLHYLEDGGVDGI